MCDLRKRVWEGVNLETGYVTPGVGLLGVVTLEICRHVIPSAWTGDGVTLKPVDV